MSWISRVGVVVSVAMLAIGPGTAAPAVPSGPPPATPVLDPGRTVTLITGDRVTVERDGSGVSTQPAPGRGRMRFVVEHDGSHLVVVPADAVALLSADRLDRRLFDVTELLADGYGDASADTVPLIMTGTSDTQHGHSGAKEGPSGAQQGRSGAQDGQARRPRPGLTMTQPLPGVRGTAAHLDKARAAAFWSTTLNQPEPTALGEAGAEPGPATPGTTGAQPGPAVLGEAGAQPGPATLGEAGTPGTPKIWLDGLRKPMLDHSVPQIGAPAAWQAGFTGAGVTVAVLDSGIDTSHPDLAGRVVASRSFVPDATLVDSTGHGTHVASTIAGSGAASGGRYRGVAPDANLLNGKVCNADGCAESAIIAGMQWAAVDQGARVVNLSLGGPDDPGIDPIEEAVNRLTEQTGALFVVAAGNAGRCSAGDRVSSPASADAALAVGAVDGNDAMAPFSCRGPRIGDGAVKPDITAPGVNIVAARAKGTPDGDANPVDDWYTRLSGTSMATPHVVGAAALLAQANPQWKAGRIKAQLVAAARPNTASTAFEQGAGRVDVARALTQTLTAEPGSLSIGGQPWPHTDDTPVTRTVRYHNDGVAPVTLALSLAVTGPDGAPAPEGMFRLGADQVSVPAGGTAEVAVTADTRVDGQEGDYAGRLVASDGGQAVLSTPVGAQREVESYNLTLRHIDRTGAAAVSAIGYYLGDLPGQQVRARYAARGGSTTLRLPRGDYAVGAMILTGSGSDAGADGVIAIMGTPKVALTHDVELTFDARTAKPIDVRPPQASARMPEGLVKADMSSQRERVSFGLDVHDGYQNVVTGSVGEPGDPARFQASVMGDWLQPDSDGDVARSPYVDHLTWYSLGRMFDGLEQHPSLADLAAVNAEYPAPPDRTMATNSTAVPSANITPLVYLQQTHALPYATTHYFQPEGVSWQTTMYRYATVDGQPVSEAQQNTDLLTFHPGQEYTERWWAGVLGPTLPQPNWWAYQDATSVRVVLPMFGDGTPGHYGFVHPSSAHSTLYRDGVKVVENGSAGDIRYRTAPAAASYQLDTDVTQQVFDTSTRITGSWRFRSPGTTAGATYQVVLPVMAVRFDPVVDEFIRAPGGQHYLLPVQVQHSQLPDWAGGTPPAPVASLEVEVSYDDGASWLPVHLDGTARGWVAALDHPAGGFVSLRAKATDTDGNSVEQTILRAYGLR